MNFATPPRAAAPFTAGETLSGRGLIVREQALVPTSANTLLAVNLADGAIEILPLVDLPEPLGNLVWGGDALYSQSGAQLVRLDESRRLLANAEAALAKNPQDSAARCVRGEAALIAGDISGATDEFRRASPPPRPIRLPNNGWVSRSFPPSALRTALRRRRIAASYAAA